MFAADRRADQHALYETKYPTPAPARLLGLQRRGKHPTAFATERPHVSPIAHVLVAWVAPLHQLLLAQIGLDFVRLSGRWDRILSVDGGVCRRRWRLLYRATGFRAARYLSLVTMPRHYSPGMA